MPRSALLNGPPRKPLNDNTFQTDFATTARRRGNRIARLDVGCWHNADDPASLSDVRFRVKNGHRCVVPGRSAADAAACRAHVMPGMERLKDRDRTRTGWPRFPAGT